MIPKLTQLWHHLDRLHQRRVIFILLLTLSGAFLEMVGLGLIYPILNFVISGEMPMALTEFLSDYGLNDKDQIAVYAVMFFAGFFLLKNLILTYFTYTSTDCCLRSGATSQTEYFVATLTRTTLFLSVTAPVRSPRTSPA